MINNKSASTCRKSRTDSNNHVFLFKYVLFPQLHPLFLALNLARSLARSLVSLSIFSRIGACSGLSLAVCLLRPQDRKLTEKLVTHSSKIHKLYSNNAGLNTTVTRMSTSSHFIPFLFFPHCTRATQTRPLPSPSTQKLLLFLHELFRVEL